MQRATSFKPAGSVADAPEGTVVLPHDGRHLRRKLLHLDNGDMVMLDLKEPVLFHHGDRLVLDDGTTIEIQAAEERLFEIRPRDGQHLIELAWHLGNRHLPTQIDADRILIRDDHVIVDMLKGLGAEVRKVRAPFDPEGGAYGQHNHDLGHPHGHVHDKRHG